MWISYLVIGAVVFYHLVWLEDVASDLVSPCDVPFFTVKFSHFGILFLLLESFYFCFQECQGQGPVLMLASLRDAIDNNAGRFVLYSYGGRDFVDVLSSCAAGFAVEFHFDFFGGDFYLGSIAMVR